MNRLGKLLAVIGMVLTGLLASGQNPTPPIAITDTYSAAGTSQGVYVPQYTNHTITFSPTTSTATTGCQVQIDSAPTISGPWTAGGLIPSTACNEAVGAGGTVTVTSVVSTFARINVTAITAGTISVTYSATNGATTHTGSGTVTSVTCGTGLSGGTITVSGTCSVTNPIIGDTQGWPVDCNGTDCGPSPLAVVATDFCVGGFSAGSCVTKDMCYAIAQASASANNVSGDIDARGFYGQQICHQSNQNTSIMLYGGATAGSSVTGRLFLGNIFLFIDGPSNGLYFTDATTSSGCLVTNACPSTYGTPAIILPNQFSLFKGIGPQETNIGFCDGNNLPVVGCTTAWPVWNYGAITETVTGNTMTVTTTTTLSTTQPGQNIWPKQLVSIINYGTANNWQRMYVVQTVTPPNTFTVKVPTGTSSCASSCGTAWAKTPIVGVGTSLADDPYLPVQSIGGDQSYKQVVEDVGFDENGEHGIYGVMAYQNVNGGEQVGIKRMYVLNWADLCYQVGEGTSESGPYDDIRCMNLATNNMQAAEVGGYYSGPNGGTRRLSVISNYAGTNQPWAGVIMDGTSASVGTDASTVLQSYHSEFAYDAVEIGPNYASLGIEVDNVYGGPPGAHANVYLAHIINIGTTASGVILRNLECTGGTGAGTGCTGANVLDDINVNSCADIIIGEYMTDATGAESSSNCASGTFTQGWATNSSGQFLYNGSSTPVHEILSTGNTLTAALTANAINNGGLAGGTAQAQTVTLAPAIAALHQGLPVDFLPVAANSGAAPTLQVGTLTAQPITKCGSVALVAGDLSATAIAHVIYDGTTRYQLMNPQAVPCGTSALGSQAANTVLGNFTGSAAVPTANAIASCSGNNDGLIYTSGTGIGCSTNMTMLNIANTGAAAMTLNMSASTSSSALIIPNIAGGTSASLGALTYDTTNKNTHVTANGADALVVVEGTAQTTNKILKASSSTLSSVTGSAITDNGTQITASEVFWAANRSTLNSATTITSTTLVTTSLVLATPLPSTTYSGYCHIIWEQSTAVGTVTFGIGQSTTSTGLIVEPATIWNGTAFSAGLSSTATALTTATTQNITSTITPAATATAYKLDFDFTLQTNTNDAVVTIYGLTSSGSDALVVEPGSVCGWYV